MQFEKHGPDIPERLLQLHEEGSVVFFCGAGISYPAQLPGFAGLVEALYQSQSVAPNSVQLSAIKSKQFDTAIGLLEASLLNGRQAVRHSLADVLTPNLSAPMATATHEALLTLAQTRTGRCRLVTTNFDRVFEAVRTARSMSIQVYKAPLLPVPKARWDGLVYLHGLLPEQPSTSDLERLVLSSGDFGLAYLTERWAARFVSELFRNFTVCFVGYSISDPVLRYMMDALAADRLLGESSPEMFGFGSYSKGAERERANEWKAKNVTPILYPEFRKHAHLHRTLRTWAATYRDGVRGKERVVIECAIGRPLASTKQDDFVGRMVWALCDPCGLPAKRFAGLDPAPSLEWLTPLSEAMYRHGDLSRFGVEPNADVDDTLAFSLIDRPSPYRLAPRMAIVDAGNRDAYLDEVMFQLARWLTRHLDSPDLLLWIVRRGVRLHPQFVNLIEARIKELDKPTALGDIGALDRTRPHSPDTLPRPSMRTLWRLLLSDRVRTNAHGVDLYTWREHFARHGLVASVRLTLREALTPRVELRPPLRLAIDERSDDEPLRVKDLADWDIVLTANHADSFFDGQASDECWATALPELLSDFSALLRDVLDLRRELGDADALSDNSYVDQPSISAHPQNRRFHDWTLLIELARDSWLATAASAPERANLVAETWANAPYPLFRRLAFFAAATDRVVPLRAALDWILADGHLWLWSNQTKREAVRLIVALAPRLDGSMLSELEAAILAGPPRTLYGEDVDAEHFAQIVSREVWLRLARIAETGIVLGTSASAQLRSLVASNPSWSLAADQRDEFPFWMSASWEDNREDWFPKTSLPRRRSELLKYVRANPSLGSSEEDDWAERCKASFQSTAYVLFILAREGIWPVERWRTALGAWTGDSLQQRSWRYMAAVLNGAPDDVLRATAHSVSYWLRAIAKTFQGNESGFVSLASRVLRLEYSVDFDADDAVTRAINHPVGHSTEALLFWWYRQGLEDNQGLIEALRSIFSDLCDARVGQSWPGRLLLAAHVVALFRVDRQWTEEKLLPLFNWRENFEEAQVTWKGFLWTPRLYRPLMEAFKPAFLDTSHHYAALGKHGSQYASLLTYAALDAGESFSSAELAQAFHALPASGLHDAAHALVRALESGGDQREAYWKNRVAPFWHRVWPKTVGLSTDNVSEALARLAIAAREEFPSAVDATISWLRRGNDSSYVVHLLCQSVLPSMYPQVALRFLDAIVPDHAPWSASDLRICLTAILSAVPNLVRDHRYMRLDEIARRFER